MIAACSPAAVLDDATPSSGARRETASRGGAARTPTPAPASSPGPVQATVSVADQLRLYLSRVLTGPDSKEAWHRHIRRVTVGLHTATIQTDLSSSDDDRVTAEQICLVASWFTESPEGRHVTSLDVEVYGEYGDLLATHEDMPDRTSALARGWTQRTAASSKLLPPGYRPSPTPSASRSHDGRHPS